MGGILTLIAMLAFMSLPVKLGAHLVDADRKGLGWCMLAFVLAFLAQAFIPAGKLSIPLALVVASVVYKYVIGTTWPRGLGVAVVVLGTYFVLVVWLVGSILGLGATGLLFNRL
jgi:hypothetical protein